MFGNWKTRFDQARVVARLVLATALLGALLSGCGAPPNTSRAAVVLIDIQDDYAAELTQARTLARYLLANLESGDSVAIGFIDNSSFSERNFIARVTFDHRPSVMTAQKRVVSAELDAFIERFKVPSHHSDITGGVLLAADYLKEVGAYHNHLLILSDLREDLPPWLNRDVSFDLDGVDVVAVNVTRQRGDNLNPEGYRQRLANWQARVETSGGQWRVVSDLGRLEDGVVLR